jgi:hypothetical protein
MYKINHLAPVQLQHLLREDRYYKTNAPIVIKSAVYVHKN